MEGKAWLRLLDALAFSGLLFLIFLHVHFAPIHPEASWETYDAKMRTVVLAHDLSVVKEEAIETRRLLRNQERAQQRHHLVTVGILGGLLVYLAVRLPVARRRRARFHPKN